MWATWPEVLKNYAKHYQTGAPIPQELLDKVKAAREVQPGLHHDRTRRGHPARPGLAPAEARRGARRRRRAPSRPRRWSKAGVAFAPGAAALSQHLLLAHLRGRLLGRLLLLLLERGARRRQRRVVQGPRRPDARERRPLPRALSFHAAAARTPWCCSSNFTGGEPDDRAAAQAPRSGSAGGGKAAIATRCEPKTDLAAQAGNRPGRGDEFCVLWAHFVRTASARPAPARRQFLLTLNASSSTFGAALDPASAGWRRRSNHGDGGEGQPQRPNARPVRPVSPVLEHDAARYAGNGSFASKPIEVRLRHALEGKHEYAGRHQCRAVSFCDVSIAYLSCAGVERVEAHRPATMIDYTRHDHQQEKLPSNGTPKGSAEGH